MKWKVGDVTITKITEVVYPDFADVIPAAKLVVDTCIGNDRNREPMSMMSNFATSYLEDMIAAGYKPESVDYVLCTHLHLDHVGWNTRLANGKWVPTFPKASYLMDKKDLALFGSFSETEQDEFLQMQRRVFADSVQPVLDASLAKPIEAPAHVCEGVRLIP